MPEITEIKVSSVRHPDYTVDSGEFELWRDTYKGGQAFIDKYLQRFSKREDGDDFAVRKKISYNPAFAKAAINEIKNSIYSRLSETVRTNGDEFWRSAIAGEKGGIDFKGSSMEVFMGQKILPELLIMGKVGIMVDKPKFNDSKLLSDNKNVRPYLYFYTREHILSWDSEFDRESGEESFVNILLRTTKLQYEKKTGLPLGCEEVIQRFFINEDGFVQVDDYAEVIDSTSNVDEVIEKVVNSEVMSIRKIPFVTLELSGSLLADAAKYQVALLNTASSDIQYITKANFPIYVQPYNPAADSAFVKQQSLQLTRTNAEAVPTSVVANQVKEVKTGTVSGIQFPQGTSPPDFISPPSDPINASMKKQDQMKEELRQLVNLSLGSIESKHASAESKKMDSSGLESGLSYIGLELEYGENEISKIWSLFQKSEPAVIKYPKKYELKSQGQRVTETKDLMTLKNAVASKTFTKTISKLGQRTLLGNFADRKVLETIDAEIDKADYITADYQEIASDLEAGIVDANTASRARGYDADKVVPLAQEEHAKRLAEIAKSQTQGIGAARGVKDGSPTQDKTRIAAGGNS